MEKFKFDTIVSHVRNSGFLFQGSEIYGGLANTWDYGPLGSELKNNIKITFLAQDELQKMQEKIIGDVTKT